MVRNAKYDEKTKTNHIKNDSTVSRTQKQMRDDKPRKDKDYLTMNEKKVTR